MPTPRLLALSLAVASVTGAATAAVATPDGSAAPYRVGTAVVDITPTTPQVLGGFGQMEPTAEVHDPLQVRAFVVARGAQALAFAIVDTQGWFAGYQYDGDLGVLSAREQAADALVAAGFGGSDVAHVIVSSTHSHAAPTIMGIWGSTDVAYLQRVHDATVEAIATAARHTRPARLFTATAEVGSVNGSNVSQTDIYDGWWVDGALPLLVAKDPEDGEVVGMYGNVPIHADVMCGACGDGISADHIGFARRALDERYDTTAVLAMGTLGRQESIVQVGHEVAAEQVASHVTQQVEAAMDRLAPVSGDAFGAADRYVTVPGTNPALLGLILAHHAGLDTCAVTCSIDRADTPPFLTGAAVGTWITTFRIGDVVYVTQPGEAFPEVSKAIRESIPGVTVNIVGMAQDQLGYYWPAEDAPFTNGVNDSDHLIYNTSVALADINVQAAVANARDLGLDVLVGTHPTPGVDDPAARRNPGVQFFVVRRPGREVELVAAYNRAIDDAALAGEPTPVSWDFGDGTTAATGDVARHRYAVAGDYLVTATVTDASGRSRSWQQRVAVR